ncbi:MAG TPA: FAD-dependent oxidoreductase [Gemmataceae bacterium]|nr:FAD-dependent oxidoreductase [Gemmataceae bacterium]
MRIAVVGGGVSGILAARLLAQEHEITLFEAERRPGGHSRTIDIRVAGRDHRVDTGFMVFNERTYPNFCQLLRLLGVTTTDTDMSLSVRCDASGLEYQGSSLNGLFAQRRNLIRPSYLRMLADIVRFNRAAPAWIEEGIGVRTVGELLADKGFGGWFISKYLVPMAAAIWSCRAGELLDFPAHFLLGFLRNHGLLQLHDRPQWKTVDGGARRYVEGLTAPLRSCTVTDAPVQAVWRHENHVVVQARDRSSEIYDAVVLGCHADQSLVLLRDADADERRVLASFPYQPNVAVVHTDISLLPRRRRAWASWNYHVSDDPAAPVAVTYDLSRLQRVDSATPILLTLNGEERIDPRTVLDRHVFHHPVFTRESIHAQTEHGKLNGKRRTYYCGAYWGYGFHEDGVNSALAVARFFGLGLDQWKVVSTKASCTTSV